MFCYFLKIGAKRYKTDELLDTLNAFPDQYSHESGCQGYAVYHDLNRPDKFTLVVEWRTYQDMQKHFQSREFKILIGAATVLGRSSELLITEQVSSTTKS